MGHFVYLLRPVRPELMQTMTSEEEAAINSHFTHLQRHLEQGRLLLAGPCLDAAFGIVILVTDDENEARAMMESDPAVLGGVMTAELHPFRVSLLQRDR